MKRLKGIGASSGIAIGEAFIYQATLPPIEMRHVEDTEREIARLQQALRTVDENLNHLIEETARKAGEEEAKVFEAHRLFLSDPSYSGEIEQVIRAQSICAEAAVQEVTRSLVAVFEGMQDEYFRARADDLRDVSNQVLRSLVGVQSATLRDLRKPAIVIADELLPSDTASMDSRLVLGIITCRGSKSAHAAILARSLGIPAVVGVGDEILKIPTGSLLILDGDEGLIILEPEEAELQRYRQRQAREKERFSAVMSSATQPAITRDGHKVPVLGNIGSLEEAERLLEWGGEGVGLLRTEFLFLERLTAPSEEEQFQVYRSIAEKLQGNPLIIRTLDIGGDKPLPYIPPMNESNPFLGNRGIRLCLGTKDLFKTQLRAILRAAYQQNIAVMFPMVATLEEVREAKALLEEARQELRAEGQPYGDLHVGIMVEIPAAAVMADVLASEVDFFSIGTNDLTQYTLAVDRTNPAVQHIADHFHPSVLRLVNETIRRAHEKNVMVGMCGELAGEPLAVPLLLGLGLDEFSMALASIPTVKAMIRLWDTKEAQQVAEEALRQPDARAVVDLLQRYAAEKQTEP